MDNQTQLAIATLMQMSACDANLALALSALARYSALECGDFGALARDTLAVIAVNLIANEEI